MIQLENVSVRYGDTVALHPVSLTIPDGQFVVLLGPSGAGKSTFLRCFNLMSRFDSGELRVSGFAGNWSGKNLQRLRRRTGMIFQQHQLIGRRTVLQNVMMGRLGYHSVLRSLFPLSVQEQELGLQSLRRVGLFEKALCRVDELSGGQQQRVGIARVLTQQPRTILADEPVASLDPATAEKVMDLIHSICREDGMTAVVSLHQVDLARKYADRVVGMSAGRIVFDGMPAGLTSSKIDELYRNRPDGSQTARSGRLVNFPVPLAS